MSTSKKYNAYVKRVGKANAASFKVWLNLANARAARGSKRVPVMPTIAERKHIIDGPVFERVANRVDCFAVKGSTLSMAADVSDIAQIKRILGNTCKIGASYTSKRGERTRFTAPAASVAKLERKGFAVKGL